MHNRFRRREPFALILVFTLLLGSACVTAHSRAATQPPVARSTSPQQGGATAAAPAPGAGAAANAPESPADVAGLNSRLRAIASQFGGHVAFEAVNLKTGERVGFGFDQPVITASTIKLPIMIETFYQMAAGKVAWDTPIVLRHEDKVEGSGILQDLSDNLQITLADAVTLMIVESDNTATNLVLDKIGIPPVNDRMKQLGLTQTVLYKKVFRPAEGPVPPEEAKYGLGKSSPDDMIRLLTLLQNHAILTPAACDQMIGILKKQRDNDAFPRYLDQFTPPGQAEPFVVAHKTGALDQVRNDVGIVYTPAGPIAMAGFAWDSPDQRWTCDNAALLALGRLAEATVRAMLQSR
jgi:beta-lactamase class A